MAVTRLILLQLCIYVLAQNRPPQFEKAGDMLDFAIKEDTKVGSQVYQVSCDGYHVRIFLTIWCDDFLTISKYGVDLHPNDQRKL